MVDFEWDEDKEILNIIKHGIAFSRARLAFEDLHRVIVPDAKHSHYEMRWLCLGMVDGDIMTVRFTYRDEVIRIIGAAHWRKGRKHYEKEQKNTQ